MKKKTYEVFDDSFYVLANNVTKAINKNKENETTQKEQVETLLAAEKQFKEFILTYKFSTEVYHRFLAKIKDQNKNILSARPFFRESGKNFAANITPSIKANDIETLKTFDINYQLITFIRDHWHRVFPKRAESLFWKVHRAREILIENNMPLAINRAKLFYRKTPRGPLSLMDLIGICSTGLTSGIDKFCGEYRPVFRSVLIGRMVGNLIDSYSETVIHFYPSDKKILYRAHTIRSRQKIEDIEELTKAVNASFLKDKAEGKSIPKDEISIGNLSYLLNAASTVSADSTVDDEGQNVYQYTADENQNTESTYIETEATVKMIQGIRDLPLLYRKVLEMSGISMKCHNIDCEQRYCNIHKYC